MKYFVGVFFSLLILLNPASAFAVVPNADFPGLVPQSLKQITEDYPDNSNKLLSELITTTTAIASRTKTAHWSSSQKPDSTHVETGLYGNFEKAHGIGRDLRVSTMRLTYDVVDVFENGLNAVKPGVFVGKTTAHTYVDAESGDVLGTTIIGQSQGFKPHHLQKQQ